MSGEDLVVIGEVVRPHGVHGAVRVTLQTDRPERFEALRECVLWDPASDARTPGHIRGVRRQGDDAVLLSLAEYDSPEAARALVGRLIALPRAQALPAPPGHAYPWQLAGCRVELEDGRVIGELRGVEPSPAQDLWIVRGPEREHLIPAVPEIIWEVDLEARRIVIRPPEGLLDI
ncbi:MAG: 16S rRNA processing protein RimM [Candidatus Rokuibacteriota bacterium]|nr:MAG: 16S rRNA processing protein RimM [Candidatus Rokubacteria bacterium]